MGNVTGSRWSSSDLYDELTRCHARARPLLDARWTTAVEVLDAREELPYRKKRARRRRSSLGGKDEIWAHLKRQLVTRT